MSRTRRRIAPALVACFAVGVCAAAAAWGARSWPVPRTLWQVSLPGRGAPVTDGTSVYFLSKDHEVVAVEIETGRTRWRRATLETVSLLSGAALQLSGGFLVVGDYNLLAFDTATGGLRWRFVPGDGFGPGVHMGAVNHGAVFTGSSSGHVYAVDVESGARRWSTPVGSEGKTTVYAPAANGPYVAAAYTEFSAPTRGGVALLDADTGRVLWNRPFPAPADPMLSTNWAGGPVFLEQELAVASGDGNIHGVNLETGDVAWTIPKVSGRVPFPAAADRDFRALAVDGDILVSGSLTGLIAGYDLTTHDERWRYPASDFGSSTFRIAAAGGAVYVPFANGKLAAIGLDDGQERWRVGDYSSGFLWPPAVLGDLLFVNGSGAGMVAMRMDP